MTSFRSRFYPQSTNAFLLRQESSLQIYAGLAAVLMLGIMVMVVSGKSPVVLLTFSLVGVVLAILMGNSLGGVKLKRTPAEIFFLESHFSLISVQAILNEETEDPFPLMYANASTNGQVLQFTYHDQVMTLKREDWEEFDLICQWMQAGRG